MNLKPRSNKSHYTIGTSLKKCEGDSQSMKVIRKRSGEVYVEWKSILDLLATGVLLVGGTLFAIASFYAFWVLLEFLR